MDNERNPLPVLKFSSTKDNLEYFLKWGKQLDSYLGDCYKTDRDAKLKTKVEQTSMAGFMEQE